MGNKIITEEDFWVCTLGAMPVPLQGSRESLHNLDDKKYITKEDTCTLSWGDFNCKKYMLLFAILAAVGAVTFVAVSMATVATGGLALVAVGAVAGLVGGWVGSVAGTLLCGQKMGHARKWLNSKSNLKLQGIEVITGSCEMQCKAGGIIRYAPNIKNWTDALNYADLSYTNEMMMCTFAGAGIGMLGSLVGVGAIANVGGLTGTGVNFAGRAMTLAKPTITSVLKNISLSFGPIGGMARIIMGAENAQYTHSTDGINKAGHESTPEDAFLQGALPEYDLYLRVKQNGLSGLQWTDTLFLLYILNIKVDPKGIYRDLNGAVRYQRNNPWNKRAGSFAAEELNPRAITKARNGKPYESHRPSHKKSVIEQVFEANKKPNGKVLDPATYEEISWSPGEPRNWHMGHKPGYEYRHLLKAYNEGRITKEQFLEYYNDPKYYRPETPATSHSHEHELNNSYYDFDKK